jgi:hypothetical protein
MSSSTSNGGSKAPVLQPANLDQTSRLPSKQPHQISQSHPQHPEHISHPYFTLGEQTYQMNRFLDELPDFKILAVPEVEGKGESERLLRWRDALRTTVSVLEEKIGAL